MAISVVDYVLTRLKEQGVTHLFGVPALYCAALFDAAKRHAAELRDAALRDFWRSVARRVRSVRAALSQLLARPLHGRPWWS